MLDKIIHSYTWFIFKPIVLEYVKPKSIILIAIVVIIVPSVVFAISPYFTESMINEEFPSVTPQVDVDIRSQISTELSEIEKAEMDAAMIDAKEVTMSEEELRDNEELMTRDSVVLKYSGEFAGVNDGVHNAEGSASVFSVGADMTVLRLENFAATNGPALKVYLSADKNASDYVSLGSLKANRGNQNYEIPSGIDLERYNKVLIWCEPFRVLFGSAEIVATG